MTVVLDEYEWVEEMMASRSLGKKPFETMCRVAKYYLDKKYDKKEVRRMMDAFLIRCEPGASLPKWSDLLDYALLWAQKYKMIKIEYIDLTETELSRINELESAQIRRLAFTLLCLAKYYDIVSDSNSHWVNCRDSDIMKMANINTSIKRQSAMYHRLNELGMIQFSKRVDNTNVRVCFVDKNKTALRVSDFRNLGYQYMMYLGDPNYVKCQTCGIVVRRNKTMVDGIRPVGRPQLNCADCSTSIRTKKTVNSVMRAGVGRTERNKNNQKHITS